MELWCLHLHKDTEGFEDILRPCIDEVTMGWHEHFLRHKGGDSMAPEGVTIPLWLAIAFQILLDAKEVTGRIPPEVLKQDTDLLRILSRESPPHPYMERSSNTDGQNIPRAVGNIRDILSSGSSDPSAYAEHDVAFIVHHPLLCGMQSWYIQQQVRASVNWAVKLRDTIIPAALLYMSMRDHGLVGQWRDMDYFSR